ncbi:MAG: hypothetical protein GVY17_01360 [Cyanobacteria bacterium]|nr:hypothetical protein [Cyanobacteria bacterium GSL.Bin21]
MASVDAQGALSNAEASSAWVAPQGEVWASLLLEKPGFIKVSSDRELQIPIASVREPLLLENLNVCSDLGILVIDFANRRRLRLNGKASLDQQHINLKTEQVYFNCPKYIQKRHLISEMTSLASPPLVKEWETLPSSWHQEIANADTFFIASWHPERGADASHRGENPGFIQLRSDCLWQRASLDRARSKKTVSFSEQTLPRRLHPEEALLRTWQWKLGNRSLC